MNPPTFYVYFSILLILTKSLFRKKSENILSAINKQNYNSLSFSLASCANVFGY